MAIFLVNHSESIEDLAYQIQPQSVCINADEFYITSDDHFIGQILYRHDKLQLSCECQTSVNDTEHRIYWTINNKTYDQYNGLDTIELLIDMNIVQAPVTFIACHCTFFQRNTIKLKRNYQYKLYIDLKSEPSLKPIEYSIESNLLKVKIYEFIHYRLAVTLSFIFIVIGITCPLMVLSSTPSITKYILSQ